MSKNVRIPINSVVKYNGELHVYCGILQEKHCLLNVQSQDFVKIEEFQFSGLQIERYPVELAALYVLDTLKGGDNE